MAEIKAKEREEALASTVEKFHEVNLAETHESAWYGSVNTILNYSFPSTKGYTVELQWGSCVTKKSIDFAVHTMFAIYIIQDTNDHHLVLIMECKPHSVLQWKNTCVGADLQMCDRFKIFKERCLIKVFYRLCFMGPKFAVYSVNTHTHDYDLEERDSNSKYQADSAPHEWWKYSILEEEGQKKFTTIANHIKTMEAAHQQHHDHVVQNTQPN